MVKEVTLSELLKEEEPEVVCEDYDELAGQFIELQCENIEVMELIQECMVFESASVVCDTLNITTEGEAWNKFKTGAKNVFLAITRFINNVMKFIFSIITWPLRMIMRWKTKQNVDAYLKTGSGGLSCDSVRVKTNIGDIARDAPKTYKELQALIPREYENAKELRQFLKEIESAASWLFAGDFKTVNGVVNDVHKIDSSSEFGKLVDHVRIREEKKDERNSFNAETLLQNLEVLNSDRTFKDLKGPEVVRSLGEILTLSENLREKLDSDTKNLSKELLDFTKELSNVEKIFERMTSQTLFEKMPSKYRQIIQQALNCIRYDVNEIAKQNVAIAKYFRTIDSSVHNIAKIGGAIHDGIFVPRDGSKDPIDTIGDISVYVDDATVAIHGGAVCLPVMETLLQINSDGSRREMSIDEVKQCINNATKNIAIVVSSLIASWKDTDKNNWYLFIVGHEYGHMAYAGNAGTGTHASGKNRQQELADEVDPDRFGGNISGISAAEKMDIFRQVLADIPRLRKIAIKYCVQNGLPNELLMLSLPFGDDVKAALRTRFAFF